MIFTPVVSYGCETWSINLREEHRRRVFQNRVLMKITGRRREQVTGEWRRLHNEELYCLYSSTNIIRLIKSRRMRWVSHVACRGEGSCIHGTVGETQGNKKRQCTYDVTVRCAPATTVAVEMQ